MTVTIEEAQKRLPELIAALRPDDGIVVTDGEVAVAHIVPVVKGMPRPQFGSCKGMLTIISDDDEHLKDFAEYMP